MKHYGKFLPFFGRPVEYKSNDIERLLGEREELLRKLEYINSEIEWQEKEFFDFIKDEWTNEEIQEAKQKADDFNNKRKT